ncbi:MAG: AAA family ATPase [Methanolinea sp.]
MKVIGVVGYPASGKGEFSRVAGEMGIPVVVMGDVIREEARRAGLPPTDGNLGAVAQQLRMEEGMDAIARRCVPRIRQAASPVVLVDGIRGDAEVRLFREAFPGFVLVAITAPFPERARRLSARGREDDHENPLALEERDRREAAWGLDRAIRDADHVIENDGTLEEFARDARDLLRAIAEDP